MPTNNIELSEDLLVALAGNQRLFLRGGDTIILNPSQTYSYKGRTTISGGLGMTRAEATDVTAPSDRKGGEVTSVANIAGGLESRTANIAQKADADMREVYWGLIRKNRPADAFLPGGNSRNPQDKDDFDSGILIEGITFTELTIGDEFNPQEADGASTPLEISGTFSYSSSLFHRILKLTFAETGDSVVTREVIGTGYREVDNGTEWYAAITFSTGVSAPAIVGRNYQGTWQSAVTLSACTNTQNINGLAIVGSYAVMPSNAAGGHVVISLADVLAGSDTSSLQTSGYVASKMPNAVFARSAGEIFFVGDGGYIYKATSVTGGVTVKDAGSATTQNLNAIHGRKRQFVAVGASNAVAVSSDNGENWTAKTGPSVGDALTAVWVLDEDVVFVGNDDGELWYTTDFGDSWTQIVHGLGITNLHDIQFVDGSKSVGYLCGDTGSAGVLARTIDGGATWSKTTPYLHSVPSAVDFNSIAALDTNTVLVGGEGAASDGILVIVEDD